MNQNFILTTIQSNLIIGHYYDKSSFCSFCHFCFVQDVGLSEVSLEKFLGRTVELLEIIIQVQIFVYFR